MSAPDPKAQLAAAVDAALAQGVAGDEILKYVHWHVLACGTDEDRVAELKWSYPE